METGGAIIPVILCGGSGSRLWPASRHAMPKQFLPLAGPLPLFRETLQRFRGRSGFARPIVATHADHRFLVAEQAREARMEVDILVEPCRRGTAAALAAAAHAALARGDGALLLAVAADHAMSEPDAFLAAVERGRQAAQDAYIVAFGIVPQRPATGYGYIEPGAASTADGICGVRRFIEKPDAATAAACVSRGCLWNSGNFLVRADVLLAELARHHSGIAEAAGAAFARAERDADFIRLEARSFARAQAISFDHAVMERTGRAAVVPVRHDWSDLGSWSAIWERSPRDDRGNGWRGDVLLADSRDCYVRSEHGLAALLGVEGLIVVVTRDAVLVCDRSRAEEVKGVVDRLAAAGRPEASEHSSARRPWGSYEVLDGGGGHRVKRLTVLPGHQLSLQRHRHRSEHWVVVAGTALVRVAGAERLLSPPESVSIPPGAVHRLANPGGEPLQLIEVQCGPYLGEDDIERFEDAYHRS